VNGAPPPPDYYWAEQNAAGSSQSTKSANRADGAGYRLVADWLLKLDPLNPQTAARMSTAFQGRGRYDAARQALMREQVARIAATPASDIRRALDGSSMIRAIASAAAAGLRGSTTNPAPVSTIAVRPPLLITNALIETRGGAVRSGATVQDWQREPGTWGKPDHPPEAQLPPPDDPGHEITPGSPVLSRRASRRGLAEPG